MRKILVCIVAVLALAARAEASAITFVDANGSAVRITDVGGGVLTVELGNFGPQPTVPIQVLTGVFFNGVLFDPVEVSAITRATAELTGNVTTGCVPQPPGAPCPDGSSLNVGGEYAGLPVSVGPYDYGISSSGLGIFGGPNFNGPNLSDPVAVDGGQFGIVSAFGLSPAAQPGLLNEPLIQGVVVFTLLGPVGFNPATGITGVAFNYGTALNLVPGGPLVGPNPLGEDPPGDDPSAVPEPATLALLGTGLVLAARRLRR